jgi:hypothetical protein
MQSVMKLLIPLLLLSHSTLFSQFTFVTNISNSQGLDVDVTITFDDVVVNTSDCQWGYNYQIQYTYDVTYNQFESSNSPLYYLQGNIDCGANQSFFNLPNGGGTGTGLTANRWTSLTNCSTVQVSDLMCGQIEIDYEGPGIPNTQDQTLNAVSALPVEFIDFSGSVKHDLVELAWSTASETNNDFFIVERSTNGIDWQSIKEVNGAGTTSEQSNYSIYDQLHSSIVYYRLKQVDYDGRTTLLKIISVKDDSEISISIYPNPATNKLFVRGIKSVKNIAIFDALGVDLSSQVYLNEMNGGIEIDISKLCTGTYLITTAKERLRFVKK